VEKEESRTDTTVGDIGYDLGTLVGIETSREWVQKRRGDQRQRTVPRVFNGQQLERSPS
jgi:hypothetical protein